MLVRFSTRKVARKGLLTRNRFRPALESLEERLVPTAPTAGLVSLWEGEGNANDALGVNQGQTVGGTDYTAGVVGQAFHFGSTGNYVAAPANGLPSSNAPRTLDLWARLDQPVTNGEAFFAGYGNFGTLNQTFQLGATTNNVVFFSQWGAAVTGPSLNVGQWYNVAATFDGNTTTLYLDGQAVGSGLLPIGTASGTSFCLGSPNGDSSRQLLGAEDEVAVFNRSLSPDEIQAVYQAGRTGIPLLGAPSVVAGSNQTVKEGLTWTSTGSFTPSASALSFTATADYGDGTGVRPLLLGADDSFTLRHAYAASGSYTVTVRVSDDQGRTGTGTFTATVVPDVGLLLLDSSGKGALTLRGNGTAAALGNEAIVVDSSSGQAVLLRGDSGLSAGELDASGAPGVAQSSDSQLRAEVKTGTPTMADPLAGLVVPAVPTITYSAVHAAGHKVLTLQPGTYVGGISVSGDASVTLAPGLYYVQNGGISVTGDGKLTGSGVAIYVVPGQTGPAVQVSGDGQLSLSAPTSGLYQGIALFEDRSSAAPVQVSGDGVLSVTGTLYAASAAITVSDCGALNAPGTTPGALAAQVIASDLTVTNNGRVRLGKAIGIQQGQSATAAFWNSAAGQTLLTSFNSGSNSQALGNWLASTFGHLYGKHAGANDLLGMTNTQVAAYFQSLYAADSQGLAVQVLAGAFNVYATTQSLGGNTAAAYGFLVTYNGAGSSLVNVGANGSAFDVKDNRSVSVLQALREVNEDSRKGELYRGDQTLGAEALKVFMTINQAGGIGS